MKELTRFKHNESLIELAFPELDDASALFNLIQTDRATLSEWLPWIDAINSVEDESRFLESAIKQMNNRDCLVIAILVDQKPAGMVDLHAIDITNQHADIGYWLGSAFQDRGIATEVVKWVTEYAFETLDLHKLSIFAGTKNYASQRVATKSGFKQECILKDEFYLKNEFIDLIGFYRLSNS